MLVPVCHGGPAPVSAGAGRLVEDGVAGIDDHAVGRVHQIAGGVREPALDPLENGVEGLVGSRGQVLKPLGGLADLGLDLSGHVTPPHLEALHPEHPEPDGGVGRIFQFLQAVTRTGGGAGAGTGASCVVVHPSSKPRIGGVCLLRARRG